MIVTIVAAINGIDNPKPTKLATTITREIKEMMEIMFEVIVRNPSGKTRFCVWRTNKL